MRRSVGFTSGKGTSRFWMTSTPPVSLIPTALIFVGWDMESQSWLRDNRECIACDLHLHCERVITERVEERAQRHSYPCTCCSTQRQGAQFGTYPPLPCPPACHGSSTPRRHRSPKKHPLRKERYPLFHLAFPLRCK